MLLRSPKPEASRKKHSAKHTASPTNRCGCCPPFRKPWAPGAPRPTREEVDAKGARHLARPAHQVELVQQRQVEPGAAHPVLQAAPAPAAGPARKPGVQLLLRHVGHPQLQDGGHARLKRVAGELQLCGTGDENRGAGPAHDLWVHQGPRLHARSGKTQLPCSLDNTHTEMERRWRIAHSRDDVHPHLSA